MTVHLRALRSARPSRARIAALALALPGLGLVPSLALAAPPERWDVLVVFVDFEDRLGTLDLAAYEDIWEASVLDFFDIMSNGQLQLEITAVPEVYTVGPKRLYHVCNPDMLMPGEECRNLWDSDGRPLQDAIDDGYIEVSPAGLRPTGTDDAAVFEGILFVNPVMPNPENGTCDRTFPGHSFGGQRLAVDPAHSYATTYTRVDRDGDCVPEPEDAFEAMHEIGHTIASNYGHPCNSMSFYDVMDVGLGALGAYPRIDRDVLRAGFPDWFSGWLPSAKVVQYRPDTGGGTEALSPIALRASDTAGPQAIEVETTTGYDYVVECRRSLYPDDLRTAPDGTVVHRIEPGASQQATLMAPDGETPDRSSHLEPGDVFTDPVADVQITVGPDVGDACLVTVAYGPSATSGHPDLALVPWYSEPMNRAETVDIWVDSSCNGYEADAPSDPTRLRYGRRMDAEETVIGNGDDACLFHDNRLYARVRNLGTATASVSAVHIDATRPLGVGIRGADGWDLIGTATPATFPALTSIAPNDYVDVWVEWEPDADVPPGASGVLDLHSCTRVRVDTVAGELVTSNQDGVNEQENIDHFEIVLDDMSGTFAPGVGEMFIANPENWPRDFVLGVESDLPPGWTWDIAGGETEFRVEAGETLHLPVAIHAPPGAPLHQRHFLEVTAYESVPMYADDGSLFRYESEFVDAVTFEAATLPATSILMQSVPVGDPLDPDVIVTDGCLDVAPAGAIVTLDYVDPNFGIYPQQVVLDQAACFHHEFVPPFGGPWQVRAYWAGTTTQASVLESVPVASGGTGDCCESSSGPGCIEPSVQACVCAVDSYCCDVAWDSQCVSEVDSLGCGSCAHTCCTAGESPGCGSTPIESCVCAVDAYCCNVAWDSICVSEVDSLGCGSCTDTCCTPGGTPGCGSASIESCVCAVDPYCCNSAWDSICVSEVESLGCGTC